MKRLYFLFTLLVASTICFAQNGTEKIKVTDMLNIRTIGQVDLSPDARTAVFTLQSIVADKEKKSDYKYETQLWLSLIDGSETPRQLTYAEGGASQPAFSPDGQTVAFIRSVDRKPQLFLLSLAGGEPQQITDHQYGASNPQWTEDGKGILFTASLPLNELLKDSILNPGKGLPEWDYEKPGFQNNEHLKSPVSTSNPDGTLEEIRAYLRQNETDNKAKVFNKLNFQTEMSTSSEMRFSHVFIVDAVAGSIPKAITSGFHSHNSPQFAGNEKILVNGRLAGPVHPDRVQESGLYLIRMDGTGKEEVLFKPGKAFSGGVVSPSGKWLAYQESEVGKPAVAQLYIMSLTNPEQEHRHIPFDRSKDGLKWSADEGYLYFTSQSNGGTQLYRTDMNDATVEKLTNDDEGVSAFDIENEKLIFAQSSVSNPSELFVADNLLAQNRKQLSDFNTSWVEEKKLSFPEKFTLISKDGIPIEYWVMKPVDYEEGKQYPLLLEIHGGPSAMWGPGESSMWHEFQYFCAQGYGVVYSNPRGSGGYGQDFLRANMNDWGAGPASDVIATLDKTIEQGWVDTTKLLITGGSYAGYLVNWIIAHDHRFKAACSQRGVYDLNTFFGEGNAWRLVPNYFGGYPWEDGVKEVLSRESPINYVQHIATPYLIFHGENDLRTGVIQSEMLYKSLKVLGKPVEYVRHPGAGHEITRSGDNRQRIDQMLRTYEFFERWIN